MCSSALPPCRYATPEVDHFTSSFADSLFIRRHCTSPSLDAIVGSYLVWESDLISGGRCHVSLKTALTDPHLGDRPLLVIQAV